MTVVVVVAWWWHNVNRARSCHPFQGGLTPRTQPSKATPDGRDWSDYFTLLVTSCRAILVSYESREKRGSVIQWRWSMVGGGKWSDSCRAHFVYPAWRGAEVAGCGGAGNPTVRQRDPTRALRSVRPFLH